MPDKTTVAELTPHQAVEFYERAIKEKPRDGAILMDLGTAYYVAHRWDDAIGAFEQAVNLRPDLGHAHYYLGVLYAAKGDSVRARKELETVMQLGNNPLLVAQAKARIQVSGHPKGLADN